MGDYYSVFSRMLQQQYETRTAREAIHELRECGGIRQSLSLVAKELVHISSREQDLSLVCDPEASLQDPLAHNAHNLSVWKQTRGLDRCDAWN